MLAKFIKQPEDLQTKHRAICDGFLVQALQKTEKARPFLEEAKTFYKALKRVETIDSLLALTKYQNDLASACGFSEKAKIKLTEVELNNAIKKVLGNILKESGSDFRENILYRYLLTKGDTLGGSMRNLTGAFASIKFVEKILKRLSKNRLKVKTVKSATGKIQKVVWDGRMLLFDIKPRLIGKNIDVILLDSGDINTPEQELLESKFKYIACGELKGGIDPAGADEHWKTANSALGRIRAAFGRSVPALFFVGAAIEAAMAKEIFSQLKSGKLSHAANLTEEEQIDDLVNWLVSL